MNSFVVFVSAKYQTNIKCKSIEQKKLMKALFWLTGYAAVEDVTDETVGFIIVVVVGANVFNLVVLLGATVVPSELEPAVLCTDVELGVVESVVELGVVVIPAVVDVGDVDDVDDCFDFGRSESTTPTGPSKSISDSGQVNSSAWIE